MSGHKVRASLSSGERKSMNCMLVAPAISSIALAGWLVSCRFRLQYTATLFLSKMRDYASSLLSLKAPTFDKLSFTPVT